MRGRSHFVKLGELDQGEDTEFLKKGFEEGKVKDGGQGNGEGEGQVIHSWAESVGGGWVANQVWGFEVVEGKRYYVRHVVVRKGKEVKRARLVYDFVG